MAAILAAVVLANWIDSGSRRTPQHPLSTQILVYFFPMNPIATATDLPLCPLLRRSIEQSRMPDERNGDRSLLLDYLKENFLRKLNHSSN